MGGGGLAQLKRGEVKRAHYEGAVMAELWSKGWREFWSCARYTVLYVQNMYVEYVTVCTTSASGAHNLGGGMRMPGSVGVPAVDVTVVRQG